MMAKYTLRSRVLGRAGGMLLLALLGSAPSHGDELMAQHASYDVRIGGVTVAELERTLEANASGWTLRSLTRPVGLAALFSKKQIEERSRFRLTSQGVPQLTDHRKITRSGDKERADTLRFDADRGMVIGAKRGQSWTADATPLPAPLFDRHIYPLFLPTAPTPGAITEVTVAGNGKVERWRFRYADEETVTLPDNGETTALHFVREVPPPEATEFWLLPALGNLPYAVRVVDDEGDVTELSLQSYERMANPLDDTP